MNWTDARSGETTEGFRERGFLPEAFVNMLALLGWNAGTEQELFTLDELIDNFSIERVHSGGARFDYEKARWFNHEWIRKTPAANLRAPVAAVLQTAGIEVADATLLDEVIELTKERCTLLSDFAEQAGFFFRTPQAVDLETIRSKWNDGKRSFFEQWSNQLVGQEPWTMAALESSFKELAAAQGIKPGDLQLPLRIMLVGGKFGPSVMQIAEMIGKVETIKRIETVLQQL